MLNFRILALIGLLVVLSSGSTVSANVSSGSSFEVRASGSAPSGTDDLILPTLDPAAVSTAEFILLDGCHVRTQGGNLNVRSRSGRIIGKLPNGTRVRILNAGWAPTSLITTTVGRRRIRGWVATEFLADCD